MEIALLRNASASASQTGWLPVFWRRVLFNLDPLLKAAFQYAPLSANLKSRDLPVLDHPVQGAFGNLQNGCRLGESQQLNSRIGSFHNSCPRVWLLTSKPYAIDTCFVTYCI